MVLILSLLYRHSTTHLLNFEFGGGGLGGDEGWVGWFVTNSMEDKTWGFGIRRVKDDAVRQGWHPGGVVPKRNSRCGPNPTQPIKDG